ncbi:MAG: CBS domain-containing protein [Rhodospirillales bacterium]|nr:CBS domain-containing protein [Rhodospirillales bacterium]
MKVRDLMTRDVYVARPNQTIRDVAGMMENIDAGVLPVGDDDRLLGMITDRDIAIRAVGRGKGPQTLVQDIMSPEVKYCFEDEDTEHVAQNMADQQIRRLPVVNRNKQLVGILSLGDLAIVDGAQPAGEALVGISEPGGKHSQTTP